MKPQKRTPVKIEGGTRSDSSGRMIGRRPANARPNSTEGRTGTAGPNPKPAGTSSGPNLLHPARGGITPPLRPVTDRGVATGTLNAELDAIQRRNAGVSTDESFRRSLLK